MFITRQILSKNCAHYANTCTQKLLTTVSMKRSVERGNHDEMQELDYRLCSDFLLR